MSDTAPLLFEEPYPGWRDETNGPLILIVTTTLTALALLFGIARIYSRFISLGRIAIDDWIIILSIILGITYVGITGAAVHHGGGRHIVTLSPQQTTTVIKLTVISFVPGVTSFVVPKFAVAILLARLLSPSRVHIVCMWIMSVVYLLLTVGMLTINFAQCSPVAAQWDNTIVGGQCWDRQVVVNYAMAVGISGVMFDFYLASYPTLVLWGLHLDKRKKLALCCSLGFGYCAGAVAIYKCTTFKGLLTLQDYTYALGNVVLWTNIEANCVVIGACMPLLLPLVKKVFGSSAFDHPTDESASEAPSGGMSGPANGPVNLGLYHQAIHSIASNTNGKHRRKMSTTSHLDELDDSGDGKYIILEERSFRYTGA